MDSSDKEKILLILDLDETLIHATKTELETAPDFQVFGYNIYIRPFLLEFLNQMQKDFHLAIWSSASDTYVQEVVKRIIPSEISVAFVWGRSRCTPRRVFEGDELLDHYHYIKPLKKVKKKGYKLGRILIIDDSPHKSEENYGNAIYPKAFFGDRKDNELRLLAKYLDTLKSVGNVREIEKRGWRNMI